VIRLRLMTDWVDPDSVLVVANEPGAGGIPVIPTASAYDFWAQSFAPRQTVDRQLEKP